MAFDSWDKLLYGIELGECILFLGPELPLESPGGERRLPHGELARRLLRRLGGDGEEADRNGHELAPIAQRFVQRRVFPVGPEL